MFVFVSGRSSYMDIFMHTLLFRNEKCCISTLKKEKTTSFASFKPQEVFFFIVITFYQSESLIYIIIIYILNFSQTTLIRRLVTYIIVQSLHYLCVLHY